MASAITPIRPLTRIGPQPARNASSALLDDVGGLVRRGVEARGARERDVVAGGVCLCADRGGRIARGSVGVSSDAGDVVLAERTLDDVEVRQRAALAGDAVSRGRVDIVRGGSKARGPGLPLHGQLLDTRALAGRCGGGSVFRV